MRPLLGNFRDATQSEYSLKLSRNLIVPLSKESRQRILFFVDGTPLSEGAAEWLANHYVLVDKSITLLSVATKDREEVTAERLSGQEELDECQELTPELENIKAILMSRGIDKSEIETVCLHKAERAPISEKISRYAQEHGFDLVLVCKHEKKKSEEFLFGDTAIQLVRNTTIPLLVLKGVEGGQVSPV